MEDWTETGLEFPQFLCFRNGYLAASKSFDANDLDVDVSGKSFMITGANTGIGKCMTLEVAKRGGTVHMMCLENDEETRREIITESQNKNVYLHALDLSRPKRVQEFTERFKRTHTSLDVLINNAACVVFQRRLTEEGLEENFAMNTMGVNLLTTALFPLLTNTPGSRVIMVSTVGIFPVKMELDNLRDVKRDEMIPFNGHKCYVQSKRQQLVMMRYWSTLHPSVHFSAMHPGVVDTGLLKVLIEVEPAVDRIGQTKQPKRSPAEGADTAVWLAIAKRVSKMRSGNLYLDRQVIPCHMTDSTRSTPEEEELMMGALEALAGDVTSG